MRLLVCLVLSLTAQSGIAAPTTDCPNVLLIYTDDHAQWAVGAYGNRDVHTPNLDRLAADGIRFDQAFTKPVCSPSRAMLLTGLYSHRLGIPDYIPYGNPIHADNGLPPGMPTIASVLKKAGYATGLVGKWHLGYGERYYPKRFGFDVAEGYRYIAPDGQYPGVGQIPFLVDGEEVPRFRGDPRHTDVLADRAIEFIRQHRRSPFFLFLATYVPHLPWNAVPEEDRAVYQNRPVAVPNPASFPDVDVTDAQLQELTRQYYANVTCGDRNLGRVFDALDRMDLTANTLVLFFGDNGFMVGQHGLLGKGNARRLHLNAKGRISRDKGTRPNMFDDSVRVPFIARWPGVIKPGSTSTAMVSTIDVLPTLAEIAGVGNSQQLQCDGRSLLPTLKQDPNAARRDTYCDTYDMIYLGDDGEQPHMRMIRTDDWKLVLYQAPDGRPLDGGTRHELFDLKSDPKELSNLYGQPAVAAIQQELEAKLRAWIRDADVQAGPEPHKKP